VPFLTHLVARVSTEYNNNKEAKLSLGKTR